MPASDCGRPDIVPPQAYELQVMQNALPKANAAVLCFALQEAKVKRAMEFLQEPKATSEKDLAAQVCRAATDTLCCRRVLTRTRKYADFSRMLAQDAKRKAAAKRKRESKPAKASKVSRVAAAEEADDAGEGASHWAAQCGPEIQQGRLFVQTHLEYCAPVQRTRRRMMKRRSRRRKRNSRSGDGRRRRAKRLRQSPKLRQPRPQRYKCVAH